MRIIRPAQPADADAISALYRELVPDAPVQVLPERIAAIVADNNNHLWVCDDEGEVIATAFIGLCMDAMFQQQPFAIVENLVVSSHCQREGVGKFFMDEIEAFCLQQDCSKIMLLTNSENRDARDFYSAMGYDPDAKIGFIKYRKYFSA